MAEKPGSATAVVPEAPPPPPEVEEVLLPYTIRIYGEPTTKVEGYWMGAGSRPHGDVSFVIPESGLHEVDLQAPEFNGFSLRRMNGESEVIVRVFAGDKLIKEVSAVGTNSILGWARKLE